MLNTIIVMGRLTADPELKKTNSGISVVSFTLAVERSYKTGEERQTDFIDVTAWRSTAEFIEKYFSKGQMMVVQGMLQTRNYEDKNGNKRKAVEIVAGNVFFGEAKRSEQSAPAATYTPPAPDENVPFPGYPTGPLPGTKEWKQNRTAQTTLTGNDEFYDVDDGDLPF